MPTPATKTYNVVHYTDWDEDGLAHEPLAHAQVQAHSASVASYIAALRTLADVAARDAYAYPEVHIKPGNAATTRVVLRTEDGSKETLTFSASED